MALTRKMLRAMGIEDEKADEIIEAHAETVDALKQKAADAGRGGEEAETLRKQVEQLKAELAKAQEAGDPDGIKAKYEEERKAFEDYKAQVAAKDADRTKRTLYRRLLADAGVDPRRMDSIMRVADLSKVTVKDGAIEGAEELEKGIKEDWADFIPTTSTQGAKPATPPKAGGEPQPDLSKMTAAEYINWKHSQK
ncbi:MAG: hypothetical protein ACI38Z_04540 [Parafannyhessea sp.]|uniref:phage scaffolding protein n=1 Tax=Parafannyhessea sp. TaxID=2847324 RepID=UPI003F033007